MIQDAKNFIYLLLSCAFILGCQESPENKVQEELSSLDLVNPFVGTGGHGHTYPGASAPFGMMQLSPDTRLDGWDGCSGYHFSDSLVYGFSHTHLSGTGVSDYGDILFMPTNQPYLNNGADDKPGYRSSFSHDQEKASLGYYEVKLLDTDIKVRLTVSKRAGIHEYTFPDTDSQYVILDLKHRDELLDHEFKSLSKTQFAGKRFSKAWASQQMLYYYFETSHPVINLEEIDLDNAVYPLRFENPNNEKVTIKIGISAVDEEGAKNNLETEIGAKNFDQVLEETQALWEKELGKIEIIDDNKENKRIFYTSLYHTMLAPNIYNDVDGRYRGMDLKIHETENFDYYTVFSLWDTYRAAHPLYTIIDQKRTNDFINTFNAKYDEGGILPIWDLSANYTGCMIGYHAVPVIADAYLKGIKDYDVEKAFEAMKHSSVQDHLGLENYKDLGFIPVEKESESVSKTLEYAYDDWTIAQMAKELNRQENYKTYTQRAQNFKNLYNPQTRFFQGRMRNTWFAPFDPAEVNFNYTEANAWQYSLYAPQDISGHIKLMGGDDNYEKHLDQLFTAPQQTSGRHQADITGLIGQYAHGNEPSHHMAYLYNFVGKPHKTQERVYEIMNTMYQNAPDGISGNEDCGQMSAWYVLSAMGFYPVTPASNQYIIGTPLFDEAHIHLENGNTFSIVKEGEGIYIAGVEYAFAKAEQPQSLSKSFIDHSMIMQGGTLTFKMSESPTEWATTKEDRPSTTIEDQLIVSPPFIASGDIAFAKSTQIELQNTDSNAEIFYRLGYKGGFKKYKKPFEIDKPIVLTTYAERDGEKSAEVSTDFYKYDDRLSIKLGHKYAQQYSAGGDQALIDGMRGTLDYRSGTWQGSQNQDLDVTIDLGSSKTVSAVSTSFLKDQRSWIFYPLDVQVELLDQNDKVLASKTVDLPETGKEEVRAIHPVLVSFDSVKNVQKVRLKASTAGKLPEWHLGYEHGGTAWTFIDEISIN